MRVGYRYLGNHWLYLTLLFSAFSCSEPSEIPALESNSSANSSVLISKIESFKSVHFSIRDVIEEGGAIRINIVLNDQPENRSKLQRTTMNALLEIQTVTGKDMRLSVWNWKDSSEEFSGYAFYSPIDNSYHFKVPGGTQ